MTMYDEEVNLPFDEDNTPFTEKEYLDWDEDDEDYMYVQSTFDEEFQNYVDEDFYDPDEPESDDPYDFV